MAQRIEGVSKIFVPIGHMFLADGVLFEQEEEQVSLHMDGEPEGDTAMAKLVGKPVAIAAKMIISGERSQ